MNILQLSNTPLSNAPENLVRWLRDAGETATLLLHRKTNRNRVFVGGTLYTELPPADLELLFRQAEVLHFHNYLPRPARSPTSTPAGSARPQTA